MKASVNVKVGNTPAYYVLSQDTTRSGNGSGIYPGGLAAPVAVPADNNTYTWGQAIAMKFFPDGKGYYVFADAGYTTYGGTLMMPDLGVIWPADSDSRRWIDVDTNRDGTAFYALRKDGLLFCTDGAHPLVHHPDQTSAANPNQYCQTVAVPWTPSLPGGDLLRSIATAPNQRGVYVVDGYGRVYRAGDVPAITPAPVGVPFSGDIIKRIKLTQDGLGYYLLDAFGNLHPGGNAIPLEPHYSIHSDDWARDFELTENGTGYYLLDKYGGVWLGGTAEPIEVNLSPTFSADVARDLVLIDSRADPVPVLQVIPSYVVVLHNVGDATTPSFDIRLDNTGTLDDPIDWTASSPPAITLSATSGTFADSVTIKATIRASRYTTGTYPIGSVVISATSDEMQVMNSPQSISVTLVVGSIRRVFMPIALR
jgi:hypothetical protein